MALNTIEDVQKSAKMLVKKITKSVSRIKESPLPYFEQDAEIAKIRRQIDKAWDLCQYLEPLESEALNQQCKNLLSEIAVARERSSELMKAKRIDDRRALRIDRAADRFFAELSL